MPSTTAAVSLRKVGFLFCSSHLHATIFTIKSPIMSVFSDPPLQVAVRPVGCAVEALFDGAVTSPFLLFQRRNDRAVCQRVPPPLRACRSLRKSSAILLRAKPEKKNIKKEENSRISPALPPSKRAGGRSRINTFSLLCDEKLFSCRHALNP